MKKRKRNTRAALRDILNFDPITETRAFNLVGVHRTTWQRWMNGDIEPPAAAVALLKLVANGELPDPAFNGFTARNGLLMDDCGNCYTPGDLRTLQLYKTNHAKYLALLENCTIQPKLF